jgi:hypothetical protein
MWPSPPRLSLSISSVVSPAAMVVLAHSARPRSPGEDGLARGVHDAGERVVGCRIAGQAEAELPALGALVGEKAV